MSREGDLDRARQYYELLYSNPEVSIRPFRFEHRSCGPNISFVETSLSTLSWWCETIGRHLMTAYTTRYSCQV